MKKALLFIVALATVAISCTKSEVVKAPGRGREVKFDSYVGKSPLTKAESADLAYLQREIANEGGFQVYAFLHNAIPQTENPETGEIDYTDISKIGTVSAYMNKVVNWVGATTDDPTTEDVDETKPGYWDYAGVVYWPDHTTQRKLAFAAYALNAQHLMEFEDEETVTGKSFTEFTYTVPDAIKDQKDLLVTPFLPNQGLNENANAAPVQLNFKHLLSRVGFQVVANQDGDVEIDIQEVTLKGKFPTQGKVDLKDTGVITPLVEETSTYEDAYTLFPNDDHFVTKSSTTAVDIYANKLVTKETVTAEDGSTSEETKTTDSADKSNRYMMIMPSTQATNIESVAEDGTVTYVNGATLPGAYIDVQYQLTDAAVQNARVSLDGWKFEAGKSYTFIFKVSTSSIEFEVNVEDWNEYFYSSTNPDTGITTYPNGNGVFTLTPIVGEN